VPPTGRPAERKLEAVERAMRVLDAFLDLPGEVGTNELSRRTQINASTVSRLLATLVAGGYVEYVTESGR
jgi:DNA-binding IclR family transcriptional regulator